MLWWRHVQADDVFKFLDELRIARYLEGFDPVRLEAVGPPHLLHRGIGDAELGGQLTRTPVGRALRFRLRRHAHNLRRINTRLASAARQIGFDGLHAACGETTAPRNHLPTTDFQSSRNLMIADTIRRKQHNPRTPYATSVQRLRSHPAFQFDSLLIGQLDRRALIHHPLHKKDKTMTKAISIGSNNSRALH